MEILSRIQSTIKNRSDKHNLILIAGPCQIESYEHCKMIASEVQKAIGDLPIDFIFKSSYDKANRTSLSGKRGPGIEEGLEILGNIRKELNIPVLTDIHLPEQASLAAKHVDVLQIPAFLCRQTDLLIAAGETGKILNIKKGQFLHPRDMQHVAEKITSTGNSSLLLCERGTCFGYRELVVDMRSIQTMNDIGYPVIFDATHSVMTMGGESGSSGGAREFIPSLASAAVAAGASGVFIECHEQPDRAPSDGASMLELGELSALLRKLHSIYNVL